MMTKKLALTIALLGSLSAVHAQDAAAGQGKAAMCIGCHGIPGYQASFPEVHRVPLISGQNAGYLAAALTAYRKGDRRHPSMRAIAGSLTDKDIADLAAYYEQHGRSALKTVSAAPAPSAEVAALLAKGACVSCHGADFNKPIDPSYPKLAGQPADYLYVALKSYTVEGNPHVGRANPIMGGIARQFQPREMKAIAAYLSTLPAEVKVVPQPKFR